jgi:hypothetical protein
VSQTNTTLHASPQTCLPKMPWLLPLLLRPSGASHGPAPAVHHLAPGPHLEALNEMLRGLHDEGARVRVCLGVWGRCGVPHNGEGWGMGWHWPIDGLWRNSMAS